MKLGGQELPLLLCFVCSSLFRVSLCLFGKRRHKIAHMLLGMSAGQTFLAEIVKGITLEEVVPFF